MDKEEAKKRMKVSPTFYISTDECLKALILDDTENLEKFKRLYKEIDVCNQKMCIDVDAASEEELEKLVSNFQFPKEIMQ